MRNSSDSAARKPDPWTRTLAILLVLLWAAVAVVLWTPEIPNGHGFQHSRIPTMDQGGNGSDRHEHILFEGWILGSVLIATFVSLLACGIGGRRSVTNWRAAAFLVGGLLFEGVFGMLCYSYHESLAEPYAAFSGPFPEPLSWLLFGIWLVPGFFIVLYAVFFRSWVWTPDDERRFTELLARSKRTDVSNKPQQDVLSQ